MLCCPNILFTFAFVTGVAVLQTENDFILFLGERTGLLICEAINESEILCLNEL